MKNNLFFVALDYNLSKEMATNVAKFFDMRLFDSIEMFEFNNIPRTLEDMILECGKEYVSKKMKSIVKMQLDFDEAVFVANFDFYDGWQTLNDKIKQKNLVLFLNDKNMILNETIKQNKLKFLTNCCDIAIDVTDLSKEKIFDKIIVEIKDFYNL